MKRAKHPKKLSKQGQHQLSCAHPTLGNGALVPPLDMAIRDGATDEQSDKGR